MVEKRHKANFHFCHYRDNDSCKVKKKEMKVLHLNHADIISAITNGKSYGVLHVLFNKFHHLRLLQR